jgi:hypothetical protein
MKPRITVGWVMMLAALVLSLVPAATLTAGPAEAATVCDWAQFVTDTTVPDGTNVAPGLTFTKTWRLKNIGTCTWTSSYSLVFSSGNQLGGASSVPFANSVAPGQTIDISVDLTAPTAPGHYIGYWQFKNAAGRLFGIGATTNKAWWVDINVLEPTTDGVAYDLAANYCAANWYSAAGSLPCPGTDGDSRGFVLKIDHPQLENGTVSADSGLIMMPRATFDGDIHAAFPAFHVQSGDRFRSIVNCASGATSCFVTFRLDYQVGNGPVNTFWSLREKYEGSFFRTDLNLSPLAGQDVKFILTVLATGSADGDRALWVNPLIVRPGSGATPTVTPAPGTPTPTPIPPPNCERASFLADVTVPDGTTYAPATSFTKTWRLKNAGTCSWTTAFSLVFESGEQMGGPASVPMPRTVAPGETVDISVNLTAPGTAGAYRGYWRFQDANGVRFGIGTDSTKSWWVDIRVSGSSGNPAGCDRAQFIADVTIPDRTVLAPGASFTKTWRLKNTGTCTWSTSYAMVFASGERMGGPNLVSMPSAVAPGSSVDVSVNLIAPAAAGSYRGYWAFQNASGVRFGVGTDGTRPWWIDIRVSGTAATPTPTGMDTTGWSVYANSKYSFSFKYPPGSSIESQGDNSGRVKLPFTTGTTLSGKWIDVTIVEGANPCKSPNAGQVSSSVNVTINGIQFLKELGGEGTAGHFYDITAYSTLNNNACISLTFVLKSVDPGVFTSPPPPYNRAAESAVFPTIMSTFGLSSLPPTATGTATPTSTPVPGLTVRGYVRLANGSGLPGVSIYRSFAAYDGVIVATTDANGYFQSDFALIPGDEMVRVWPVAAGFTFDPENAYWRHYYGPEDRSLNFVASPASGTPTATPTGSPTPTPTQTPTSTPTSTPTATAPPSNGWSSYQNSRYGFSFQFPPGSSVAGLSDTGGRIYLPFASGTNLSKKYLDVSVTEGLNPCHNPNSNPTIPSTSVTFNGIQFLKETWLEGVTSHLADWTAYSTLKGNACIGMSFLLWSVDPGAMATPPPVYDRAAESAVFTAIMSTFVEH